MKVCIHAQLTKPGQRLNEDGTIDQGAPGIIPNCWNLPTMASSWMVRSGKASCNVLIICLKPFDPNTLH